MLVIKVSDCGDTHIEAQGNTLELLAELGVGLEQFIKAATKDCPDKIKNSVKKLYSKTINFSIDEAFK